MNVDAGFVVPRRNFGRHELTVSSLCLGGYALCDAGATEAQRIVDEALALGVDFFDNCWDYFDGQGEGLMGRCLGKNRDKVFLMTKVCTHFTGGCKEAVEMLDQSLERLKTDYLDLWQVHAVSTQEQVQRAFSPGGVIEALDLARTKGKVRFVGFSGHTDPDVHLAMLSHGYAFDSCQLPISPIEANSNAFVRRVLPELNRQNIAVLAMKTLCGAPAKPVKDKIYTVREGLTYALSLPVASVVTGVATVAQLRENAAIVSRFTPFSQEEIAALEQRCLSATESDQYQPYRLWMA